MKKNVFFSDMNRSLRSWGFVMGVIGMIVAACFGTFEQMLPVFSGQYAETGLNKGFVMELMFTALSSDAVLLILPVLCALPFTAVFLDDYKSRYIRNYLPRAGKKNYINGKVVTTALSGGITIFVGAVLILLIFVIVFLPMEVSEQVIDTVGTVNVEGQQYFVELASKMLLLFLCGCFWALVGGVLATITMSRYMAYASPFICYYTLVILSERYFKDIYVMNPQEWINPSFDWVGGIWGVVLLILELIIGTGFLYGYLIERKLQNV